MKKRTYHKYSLKGKHLGEFTKEELFSLGYTGKDVSKIKKATTGVKGYGYYATSVVTQNDEGELIEVEEGHFWAPKRLRIMSANRRKEHVDEWLRGTYDDLYEYVSVREGFDEDAFQDAIVDLLIKAVEVRGVNDYWYYINFRIMSKTKDKQRSERRRRAVEVNDFDVTDNDSGEYVSFIESYGEAEEDSTFDDRCVEDSNQMLKVELLVHQLHAFFEREDIDAWLMYHTHNKGTRKVYTSIIDKYGWTTSKCRKVVRAVEAKAKDIALDVEDTYGILKSVSLDDYSLRDLIN